MRWGEGNNAQWRGVGGWDIWLEKGWVGVGRLKRPSAWLKTRHGLASCSLQRWAPAPRPLEAASWGSNGVRSPTPGLIAFRGP